VRAHCCNVSRSTVSSSCRCWGDSCCQKCCTAACALDCCAARVAAAVSCESSVQQDAAAVLSAVPRTRHCNRNWHTVTGVARQTCTHVLLLIACRIRSCSCGGVPALLSSMQPHHCQNAQRNCPDNVFTALLRRTGSHSCLPLQLGHVNQWHCCLPTQSVGAVVAPEADMALLLLCACWCWTS
jgi:hypothetical protein